MAVKKYKPTTPGQRGMTGYTFEEITKSTPERSLIVEMRKHGGRNSYGRITVRHRGGGNRQSIRIVDFKRDKRGIPAKVAAIEYDPNRTARLALLLLRRRREALHRRPARPQGRRHGALRTPGRDPARATACRWRTSRSARWFTTSR